jgi:hypothetical protein
VLFRSLSADEAARRLEIRVEAVELVPRVLDFARDRGLVVPVFTALGDVLAGRADKSTVLPALMIPARTRR